MHLLFLYDVFILGGIETLVSRMSKWLLERKHSVTLLIGKHTEAPQLLPSSVRVLSLGKTTLHYDMSDNQRSLSLLTAEESIPIDIIFSLSRNTLPLALFLSSRLASRPNILVGIYNPWDYLKSNGHILPLYRIRNSLFYQTLPDANKLFMSAGIRRLHEISTQRNLQKARVWPLPINSQMGSAGMPRKPVHGKIVSVGRLDRMKSYNIYMVDVVKELLQRGYKVTYDISGEGPLRERIEEKIRTCKMEKYIHLRGQMDYEETEKTLSDAFVFVGMGTAVIEAAMCGVPSIPAIASATEPLTYGFLQDLPFGSCGEMLDTPPTLHISDILEKLLNASSAQYDSCVKGSRDAALEYDSEELMPTFLSYCEESIPCRPPYWLDILTSMLSARNRLMSLVRFK